jgi:hypothetical protein
MDMSPNLGGNHTLDYLVAYSTLGNLNEMLPCFNAALFMLQLVKHKATTTKTIYLYTLLVLSMLVSLRVHFEVRRIALLHLLQLQN